MIITTARKPSSRIRIFCKHLSRFTGCEYVARGKTGLSEFADKPLLVVGEHRGNPGNFGFFLNGNPVLSIYASVSLDKEIAPGEEPVIEGDSSLAHALNRITGFRMDGSSERIIRINDKIELMEKGVPFIVLKLQGIRRRGNCLTFSGKKR
ncbi:MAG: hypothetical protein J5U17_01255 [Candidatus Methanoperedens sp.]|nr:hypothetical protein [Candidatus Methanoperedens sp.]MCE8424390.1 hypothetical protein [Candidatus Methanoperedens sp.]MCE8427280.1 hypothetical protein [Candidatus Methanoperedens sp.]